jgi:hypothetical protein
LDEPAENRMTTKNVFTLGVAALLLVACIPSVNPFYRAEDISFDPALIGEWIDGDERWVFERYAGEDAYQLTFSDGEDTGSMKATLFRLGDHRFLDLVAENIEFADDQWELIDFSVFPGHLVMHVAEIGPQLRMAVFDLDWMEDLLGQNPNALEHTRFDDRILLTGSTRELQRFLKKHVDGGELFPASDYSEMVRR